MNCELSLGNKLKELHGLTHDVISEALAAGHSGKTQLMLWD